MEKNSETVSFIENAECYYFEVARLGDHNVSCSYFALLNFG